MYRKKPLTREGLNNSIILCVRDKKHKRFSDSLLGCVKTSLNVEPIYFSCFPNFFIHNVLRTLKVDIKTHVFDM